jgi:membrane protein implicated in regulation of membrane protease activity
LIGLPKRPYRDSAIFHGVLAVLLVGVAWLTGGGLGRAVVVGALYFVAATAWTWWRFRQRIERERSPDAAPEPQGHRPGKEDT